MSSPSAVSPASGRISGYRLRRRCTDVLRSLAATFIVPAPFQPPATEERFLHGHGHRFVRFRRAAATLAFLILSLFVIWDTIQYFKVPDFPIAAVLGFRAWIIAVCGWVLLRSLRPSFCNDRTAHRILIGGIVGTTAGELAIVAIVPANEAFNNYFLALCSLMIYLFGFLHLRAKPVVITTVGIVLAVAGLHLLLRDTPRGGLLAAGDFGYGIAFLSNLAVIGIGISVKFERDARRQFLQQCALIGANEELVSKHAQLVAEKEENLVKAQALIGLKDEQRAQALRASEETARFLASAAHDLRQPMFGLNLALEAMHSALESSDVAEARRLAVLSMRSARAMATSFNAVLDLSRLESGFYAPEPCHFDVCDLLAEVAADLAPFAQKRQVRLRLRLPKSCGIHVFSDRQMLSRIVRNLTSNGIKYARHDATGGAVVVIGAVRLANRVRIDVLDNGIGIPAEQWQRVFDPFVQLHNPERDREKGLGLGLSIVTAMVALMREHRLELNSIVGQGTRFSLDVPRGQAEQQLEVAAPHEPAANVSLQGLYVLVIEDDPLVRTAVEALLNQWGMLVDAAAHLEEVKVLAAELERVPDLVLTDFHLPNGATARDALDILLPACRGTARRTAVLVVSGEPAAARAALGDTADEVLPKPVQPDRLKDAIERLAGHARQLSPAG